MPRRTLVWWVGSLAVGLAGCLHAPTVWSPDGRWLAYTIAVRPQGRLLTPGWLFDTQRTNGAPHPRLDVLPRPPAPTYRLWATRADSGRSVLLEESRGPITSPSWSPDGKALAFGRLVPLDNGHARFEVVVQEAPDRQRIISTKVYSEFNAKAADLPGLSLAWSPDGRYLAIPLLQQSLGFAVLRAENGRVSKVVDDAYYPTWSPDGSKLAFIRGGEPESLQIVVLDATFGPPRHLADIGQTSQAPVWTRNGRSLVVVGRSTTQPQPGQPAQASSVLNKIDLETGRIETIATLSTEGAEREKPFNETSFCFDRTGENLFFSTDAENQPTQITWIRLANHEVHKRFHPVDFSIRLGALSTSPDNKWLACRIGPPGWFAPPALYALASASERDIDRLTPIVPDDSARAEWLVALINASGRLIRATLPFASGGAVDRATVLPVPGELPANHETLSRLRRLGIVGRRLCERPADSPPPSPALRDLIVEARFFFDYLSQDYRAALRSLETLEGGTDDPERRLRLLSVRAQIFLGLGDIDRAKETIAYLQSLQPSTSRRLETSPLGPSLSTEDDPKQGWVEYLARQAEKVSGSSGLSGRPEAGPNGEEPAEVEAGVANPFQQAVIGEQALEHIVVEPPVVVEPRQGVIPDPAKVLAPPPRPPIMPRFFRKPRPVEPPPAPVPRGAPKL